MAIVNYDYRRKIKNRNKKNPNISHEAGLKLLKEALDRREIKISTEDLAKMAKFVLRNN